MELDDVKKLIMMLRDALLSLSPQDRQVAMDFLSDCFGDLHLKILPYEEDGRDEVLNLTKKVYFPLDNSYEVQDPYLHFRLKSYPEPHDFSNVGNAEGCLQYAPEDDNIGATVNLSLDDWGTHCDSTTEASNPVNLVLPQKEKASNTVKKSRRKQMFTRKSVRRLSDRPVIPLASMEESKEAKCNGTEVVDCGISHLSNSKSQEPLSLSLSRCRSPIGNSLQLRNKEDKKSRPKVGLICPECGDKFKFESHYMKHLYGHRDNNCKNCPEKFSSRAQCRDHMKRAHPDVKIEKDLIPCKFCPMSFPRHHRLYNHYRLHHSKGKFVCTSCGLFLSTKEKHKEHMLEHENEKKWKCDVCGKKFYSLNILTNHMKIHNSGIYECLTCKTTVASKVELVSHKKNNHKVRGLEPKFECEKCHKMFPKKSVLERHLAIHAERNFYSCNHCVKTFSSLEGLVKHQKRKTHFNKAHVVLPESKYEKLYEDQLVCETCGKQYKTYTQLMYHLRTHKATYVCEKCDKTFTMKVNLRRHLKLHESSKVAVCELCGDSFARVGSLNDHMLIKHSDNRPAKCTVCPKTFKGKSALNRHMRIHEKVRPYVCVCGRDYKQAAHLRAHQKSVHMNNMVEVLINDTNQGQRNAKAIEDSQVLGNLPPDLLERERAKNFGSTDHGALLGLENFEEHDYRLQDSFKVPYVGEDYGQQLGYNDLQFEAPPAVSPAVDLSMVAISDVVCRDMDTGLIKTETKSDVLPPDSSSAIQLVNLSEHIVQEYLLNLP